MGDATASGAAPALAVIQARMSSTRLPGKVLADVAGQPLLDLLLDRLARSRTLDHVVVATSTEPSDDPIAAFCEERGVVVHRGSLDDVLERFVGAIGDFPGIVVRITADCPLIDPTIVDAVVEALVASPASVYSSNVEPRTFPDGLDVEAIRASAMRELDETVTDPGLREHVTLQLRRDPSRWPRTSVVHQPDLGSLRWTVDTASDLDFVRAVVDRLGPRRYAAGLDEILESVRRGPSLSDGGLRG